MKTWGIAGTKGARRTGAVWGVLFLAAAACGPAFSATLEWGTYLGGSGNDYARGVALDGDGNLYVVGTTDSVGWVSGGWDTTHAGDRDGYAAKFSASGTHLWSTYFGGTEEDSAADIAVALNGDVFVVGGTGSPAWAGSNCPGGWNGFVLALSSSGAYRWSTYQGGNLDLDGCVSVAIDAAGAVYVAMMYNNSFFSQFGSGPGEWTYDYQHNLGKYSPEGAHQWTANVTSTDWLDEFTRPSAVEIGLDGGLYFLSPSGITRRDPATGYYQASCYWGGGCSAFAVDADGNVVLMREDWGGEVSGGWRTTPDEAASYVLDKYGPDGSRRWSSYLPYSRLALDATGNIYAAGFTTVPDWLGGGPDATHNGGEDGVLVKLSPDGAHLWSTYLGGAGEDRPWALAVSHGHAHVAGRTTSAGWLEGGWDPTYNGAEDGFLLKFPVLVTDPWTLQATVAPAGAVALGAQWRLSTDTVWRDSGDTATGPMSGECRVLFKDVQGYTPPAPQTVAVTAGGTFTVVGEYAADSGEVRSRGTYLGGAGNDAATDIAVDSAGNILVTGTTNSPGWVSNGGDTVLNDGVSTSNDAFVVKLSPQGAHLWSTYLGGSKGDYGNDVVVDGVGDVLVTGTTYSPGWVSGGGDTVLNNGTSTASDAFAVKLSPEGTHLWSTYLGGADEEYGNDIAVDGAGNVLVTGSTGSPDWVSGGGDTVLNDGVSSSVYDAFAVKLSPEGAHLWSTYLGGVDVEYGRGIAADDAGNVLVTGTTLSPGWVSGGANVSYQGGGDAFVCKLAADGAFVWSTYLGGAAADYGNHLAVNAAGSAVVSGYSESAGWVSGGWDESANGGRDGFVVSLSPEGIHLWSTYLGGDSTDAASHITLDSADGVYVAGYSYSPGWVSGGPDPVHDGDSDAFVVALDAAGAHRWSTFLGGDLYDSGIGIALTGNGSLCIAGETESLDWLHGGWDETHNGGRDGYVAFVPLAVPPAPSNPGAMAIGADTITWTWVDNSSDETGFNVWVDPGAGAPVTLQATTAADAMAWTQGGLPVNSLHTFQVAATNADGDSARTAPFPAWTLALTPAAPVVGNPTGATLDVSVGAGDGNPAGTEYALRCVTTGQWVQADSTLGETAAWQAAAVWGTVTVSGLAEATEHTFEALARNGAGVETAAGPTASGVTLEMVPPTAAVTLLDPTPTQAAVLRYGVIFSAPVAPTFTVDDVSLTGALAGTAAVDGADPAYTVTVTLTGANPDGLTGIAIGTDVRDAAGNGFAGALSPQYDVVWWPGFAEPPAGSVLGYTGDPGPVLDASVAAGAPRAAVCQWWRDDGTKSVVAGPATAVWDLGTLSPALDGVYWCSVAYGGLTLTTAPVEVRVRNRIALTAQPADQTIVPGGTAVFTVSAAGGYAPLHYQWRRNGANAPDSPDAAAWTLENVTAEQAGAYSVVVSDSQSDTEESGMAVLKVEANVPATGLLGLAALAGALALAGRRRRDIRR